MGYNIAILDILPESITDGWGLRAVIFCAGCNFKCEHCHNPKSWNVNNGYKVSIQEIYEKLNLENNLLLGGITFSGGEPMLRAKAFLELAKMIKTHPRGLNVWCYTGYLYEDLINRQDNKFELLKIVDFLVDGRYMHDLRDTTLTFRGSSNQRIIDVQESFKRKKVVEKYEFSFSE